MNATMTPRRSGLVASILGVIALVAILVVATTGGSADDAEVSMTEYAFDPEDIVVEPGADLHVTNDGAITHSLVIVGEGKGVELHAGEDTTLELSGVDPGTYDIICDLPGHQERGMVGTLTIGR
jgi:plastocyanin